MLSTSRIHAALQAGYFRARNGPDFIGDKQTRSRLY